MTHDRDVRFDYGSVIRAAVAGAITSVVTAPFRMLAGLFGKRKAEELRKVEFEPGSDRIALAQREKLDSLAEALKQRPQLTLVVHGPYDAKRDGERLRRELARRDLAHMVGTKVGPEEDPGPIAYGKKCWKSSSLNARAPMQCGRSHANMPNTLAGNLGRSTRCSVCSAAEARTPPTTKRCSRGSWNCSRY